MTGSVNSVSSCLNDEGHPFLHVPIFLIMHYPNQALRRGRMCAYLRNLAAVAQQAGEGLLDVGQARQQARLPPCEAAQ